MKLSLLLFIFGLFYFTFEGIFNAIFSPAGVIMNNQDKNKDGKKDRILAFGYCSLWMIPAGIVDGAILWFIFLIPIMKKIFMLPVFMIITCIIILSTELIMGTLFLKATGLRIWDYSNCWGNYKGHIEPLRGFGWFMLGIAIWVMFNWFLIVIWK